MDRDASLRKLLKEVKIARNYIISTEENCYDIMKNGGVL